MTVTIRKELQMTTADVGNSNIAALTGTLLVRFLAGPACDRWGPRYTYIGILALGAIPTALAGLVRNVSGLIALRFFIGILGGTFVPCQVWSTGFFDKNVVGSANALIGGWGNAGGGITYFLMPLIYDCKLHGLIQSFWSTLMICSIEGRPGLDFIPGMESRIHRAIYSHHCDRSRHAILLPRHANWEMERETRGCQASSRDSWGQSWWPISTS